MATLTPNGDTEVIVAQKGTLKLQQTDVTGGVGNNSTNFTVPTGKKWILKASNTNCGGGVTGTDQFTLSITKDSKSFFLFKEAPVTNTYNFGIYQPAQDIELSSGDVVKTNVYCAAAENFTTMILVQEFDA